MKNIKSYIIGLMAASAAMTMTSCQDDIDSPSMNDPVASITANTSILDLKAKYWNDADNYIDTIETREDGSHYIISGRVISSDESGNVFKSLVIQDETAALAISINSYNLYLNYRVGQEIVMDVTGMCIGKYAGLQQMGMPSWYENGKTWQTSFMSPEYFQAHRELNGIPQPSLIDTLTVNSFSEISANPDGLRQWQSQLVRFNNVYFENGGTQKFSEYHSSGMEQNLKDVNGGTLIVRTSGYCNFWNNTLPSGNGDVVGILGYYASKGWQLTLIDYAGCMNFGNPTLTPGTEANPYSIEEVIANESAEKMTSGWVTGYIVGAVAPGLDAVATNDDVEWTAPTVLANTLVIGKTADTKDINECLVVALTADSKFQQAGNLRDNAANLGKQIWVRGNFEKFMGTYGITGNNGTASEFKIEGLEPETPGTQENPLTVSQVIAMNPQSTDTPAAGQSNMWVGGYIVGSYKDYNANFTSDNANPANILLAETPDANTKEATICVQLLASTPTRAALNLMDNPGNLGKYCKVYGDVLKYNTLPGIKNTSNYEIDGTGGETPNPSDVIFSETFKTSMGDFTIENVTMGSGLSYVWKQNETYGYMNASAFVNGTSYASDSWLISPVIDLNGVSSPILSFEHLTNKYPSLDIAKSQVSVSVRTEGGSWQKVAIPEWSTNADWNFVNSGNLDLTSFVGKKIQIGFRYTSEDGVSGTWRIKNLEVKTGTPSSGGTVDPDPDPTPDPDGEYKGDFNTFNGGSPKTTYGTYTNATGWTATNAVILSGGDTDSNPKFTFIGDDKTLAPTLDGKPGILGKLTSPTLTGGCGKLTFNYGFAYSEKGAVQFVVKVLQGTAVVATKTVDIEKVTGKTAIPFSLDVNINGDFTIEIENTSTYDNSTTKHIGRVSIWNLTWTN